MISKEYLEESLKSVSAEIESIVARFNALKGQEAVFNNLLEKFSQQAAEVIEGASEVVESVSEVAGGASKMVNGASKAIKGATKAMS